MKKIYLSILMIMSLTQVFAQSNLVVEAPLNDNTNSTLRAPNGFTNHAFYSGCYLVLQDELKNIPSGTSITSFGFTLAVGVAGSAAAGNFTLWLQNTTDNTYQKGTSFSGAISGMTQVFANVMTIPMVGATQVVVTLSTPFTYNGNGLYVAYDWTGSSYGTNTASFLGETTRLPLPGGGGAFASSPTSAQNSLVVTNSRPSFLFGFTNNNTNDVEVLTIFAPGKVPAMLNSVHTVTAVVRNLSNTALSNVTVNLNVSGANVFTGSQVVSAMNAGALSLVQFPGFNPQNVGMNTLSVSVNSDQNNLNNSMTYSQQVTCNVWSSNPPVASHTVNGVGWTVGTVPPTSGAGIISTTYNNPVSSTLTAIRTAISSSTLCVGNNVYGTLQDNVGTILATTSTVNITSGMLGTYITFTFSTPPVLSASTTYYLGMAAMAGSAIYRPYGTYGAYYLPNFYSFTPNTTGGSISVLPTNFGYFGFEGVFKPNIQLSAVPTVVSCGSNATLQAVSSTNYSWSTGATSSSIVVTSPTVNAQYTVTATNTLGCSVSTIAVVNVTPFPFSVSSSSANICLGDAVTITANGGFTYTWSTNSNASAINESPNATTLYTVVSKNLAGCSNTAAITVAVQSFSTLTVAPSATTICKGGQVNFNAGSAVSYTWETGATTVNTSSINSTPQSSGIYTVTGANPLGCLMSKTVSMTVNSTTIVATPDTSICRGSTITLSATGATNYVWNSTYSFAAMPVSPSVATVYNVTGVGPTGCPGSSSLTVSVNENPTVTAVATRTFMCKNDKNTITASGAATYSWSNNNSTPSIVITPTNTLPQNYTVTGFNAEGCKSTAKINITVSNCTGLSEQTTATGFRVFPNPTTGALVIELNEPGDFTTLEVYNALGQIIHHDNVYHTTHPLNLSEESNGVYVIKIIQNGKVLGATRLIKN